VYFFVAIRAVFAESITFTVKVAATEDVGVPEITPAEDRDNPLGRLPDWTDQW
jgi:hypothetical protein